MNVTSNDGSDDQEGLFPSDIDFGKKSKAKALQKVLKELRVAKAKKSDASLKKQSGCASKIGDGTNKYLLDVSKIPKKNESKPYRCSFCEKCFARRDTLTEHLRTHTKEKPFACKFCTMRFPTQSTRRKHEDTHVGDKRYQCSHCGLLFSGKPSLNYHLKVHSGERPHKCEYCGKGFIQNSHLRRHVRVHTGEKPFSCSYCGLKFMRSCSLQNHIRKHTGEILYTCQHCDKTFHIKETFDYHLKLHTGIKPFTCSACGWSFIKGSHLKRHMRKHAVDGTANQSGDGCVNGTSSPSVLQNGTAKDSVTLDGTADGSQGKLRPWRGRWSYTCTYCPKQFAHKRSLESHLKFHDALVHCGESSCGSTAEFMVPEQTGESDGSDMSDRLSIGGAQLFCNVDMQSDEKDGEVKIEPVELQPV